MLFDNPSRNETTQKIIFNPFVKRTKIQINKMFDLIKDNYKLTEIMTQKLDERSKVNAN